MVRVVVECLLKEQLSGLSDKAVHDLREHVRGLAAATAAGGCEAKLVSQDEIVSKSCQSIVQYHEDDGTQSLSVHVARSYPPLADNNITYLPSRCLMGGWGSLHYPEGFLASLWAQVQASVKMASLGVDRQRLGWGSLWLLHGPPGCGKSSVALALGQRLALHWADLAPRQAPLRLLHLEGGRLMSKWLGESSRLITEAFADLNNEPAWVVIDEVESLALDRGRRQETEPGDAVRAVNTLLCQLDRLGVGVWVIMTSNLPHLLDPALRDRLDWEIAFGPPEIPAIAAILTESLDELVVKGVISETGRSNLSQAAQSLAGNSGRCIRKAIFRAYCHPSQPRTTEHLLRMVANENTAPLIKF